jgi:hypothetical protein
MSKQNFNTRQRHPVPVQFSARRWRAAAVALLMQLCAAQSFAAESPERPYNPPVGSRWIIESETSAEQVRPDGPRTSLIKIRAELTIDEKTADGFRVSYVNRGATAEGNDPSLPLLRSTIKALENVTIRATTDASGKPIRIDNLDEAKAAMRAMNEELLEPFKDKPQLVAMFNQMMSHKIEVDAGQAASSYVEELSLLAKAQGTGMNLGDVRRSSKTLDNPLGGGGLKSNTAVEMTSADAATGKLTFVNSTSYDAESMKDFMQSFAKKLLVPAAGSNAKPEQVETLINSIKLSLDQREVFEVEDGMTRKISEKSVTTSGAVGHTLSKTETRTITVTPAP